MSNVDKVLGYNNNSRKLLLYWQRKVKNKRTLYIKGCFLVEHQVKIIFMSFLIVITGKTVLKQLQLLRFGTLRF